MDEAPRSDLKVMTSTMTTVLTKHEVARRQLGTALALFLADQDSVAVQCLACGGSEIAETWRASPDVGPCRLQTAKSLVCEPNENSWWNAFKHATARNSRERDDRELLANFSDEMNEPILFIGWFDYGMAADKLPVEAQAFLLTVAVKIGLALLDALFSPSFDVSFKITASREEQKRGLRELIEAIRGVPDLVEAPWTDSRPLILSSR
jgi:hypothetical protein